MTRPIVRKYGPKLAAVSSLVAVGAANAAIDVTEGLEAIGDAGLAVAGIGAAVFLVVIGIKVWKWAARAS